MSLLSNIKILILAIINNDTANTLAIINDKKGASDNLNYIIGGLIVVVIILVGNTLFNKK